MINNDKANDSLHKTEEKAGGLASKLGSGIKTAAKWGAAIGAAAIVVGGAMLNAANKAADTTDRIDKLSQKIGISRQAFQEWDFILSQSGTDIEKMQVGMKTLVQRMDQAVTGTGEGADAFNKLGLSVTDLNGGLKSQEQMFEETAIALQGMPEGAEKSQLAFELFGKAGLELMPMLNGASGSIEEMKARAEELGLVMSDESIDAGVKYQDTMDQLKRSFGAVTTTLATEFMPVFIKMAEWVMDNMPQIKEFVSKAFKVIGEVVGFVIEIFKTILPVLVQLYDWIKPALPTIAKIVKAAFTIIATVVGTVVDVFDKVTGAIKKAYDWLTQWNNKDAKKKTVEVEEKGIATKGRKRQGASGLAYVPYDGFEMSLHKGERVLSRGEVAAAGMGNVTFNITGNNIANDYDVDRIADRIMNKLAREQRRNK